MRELVRKDADRTSDRTWNLEADFDERRQKFEVTDVRVCAREISTRFPGGAKLLKGMVARDGIEPPTPAFSGPRSTN